MVEKNSRTFITYSNRVYQNIRKAPTSAPLAVPLNAHVVNNEWQGDEVWGEQRLHRLLRFVPIVDRQVRVGEKDIYTTMHN